MIRILIVDDQKSIRERLKSILASESDFEIVGMVDNGYDAIEIVKELVPDVVLMDMEMPDIDGVLATKIIAQSNLDKKVQVLVLSSYNSNEYVAKSIHAGAKGYLLKGASAEEIRDAVRFVHRGYTQIAPGLFEQFIPNISPVVSDIPRPVPIDLDLTGLTSLTLTGFQIQKRVQPNPPPIVFTTSDPSSVVVEVTPTVVATPSPKWLQVAIMVLSGLALTGVIYVVRQGLRQPLTNIHNAEQTKLIHETPFIGKIEAAQVTKLNALVPGFVQEVKTKVGQLVQSGEPLLIIRNVDAERVNQEKIQQQSAQNQQVIQQQAIQQQALLQQQQAIIQQQQSSQQRSAILDQQISNYHQTIAPLRAQIVRSGTQISQGQLQTSQAALVQQKKEAVQKARSHYQRQQIEYGRKQKLYESKRQLFVAGGIARDQVDQVKAEADSAKIEMNAAQLDFENANSAWQEAQKVRALNQPVQSKKIQLEQQLALREQEEQLRKLQEQLRQEQLTYQQLNTNLQAIRQRSSAMAASPPAISPTPSPQNVLTEVLATTTGYVVELPVNNGDQVFTGTKLIGIANGQQHKVTVEVEDRMVRVLQNGAKSIVKIKNSQNSQDFHGKIVNITPSGENRKQKVDVEFTAGNSFLVGQSATVYFPPQ